MEETGILENPDSVTCLLPCFGPGRVFGLVQTRVTLGDVKATRLSAGRTCPGITCGGNSPAAPRRKCYPATIFSLTLLLTKANVERHLFRLKASPRLAGDLAEIMSQASRPRESRRPAERVQAQASRRSGRTEKKQQWPDTELKPSGQPTCRQEPIPKRFSRNLRRQGLCASPEQGLKKRGDFSSVSGH